MTKNIGTHNDIDQLPNLNSVEEIFKEFDQKQGFTIEGRLWCPTCSMENRFTVHSLKVMANTQFSSDALRRKAITGMSNHDASWISLAGKSNLLLKSSFVFDCVTCHTQATCLVHGTPDKVSLLVLFSKGGSIATKRTPETVRYFLEQAYLC